MSKIDYREKKGYQLILTSLLEDLGVNHVCLHLLQGVFNMSF